MGHIDHGKSTLLDYIRKTNVTETEAGGITQRISAYQAVHTAKDGTKHPITFLDTPGHESFVAMRERGATVADIAILVVAADDCVKPQTIEALKTIRSAKIPFIVAINKIDRDNADIERTKATLAENDVYVEGYGGDVPVVAISAKTGQGVPELLDMLVLVAELADLKGDPTKPVEGAIIEAHLDKRKGISATVIVKNGTIRSGQFAACVGMNSADETISAISPIRMMENFLGASVKEAGPSSPVRIIGWDEMPAGGSPIAVFDSKKEAENFVTAEKIKVEEKSKTENRKKLEAAKKNNGASGGVGAASSTAGGTANANLNGANKNEAGKNGTNQNGTGQDSETPAVAVIPLVIKASDAGGLDAIKHEIEKIKNDRVKIRIIASGVGDIGENDIKTASGRPETIVLGFNVTLDAQAKTRSEKLNTEVETFDIIYKLSEWLAAKVIERVPKQMVEETLGQAKILKLFSKNRDRQVIGGRVEKGEIKTGADVKILRRDFEIGRGKVRELQRQKNKVSEVPEGQEFGTMIEAKMDIAAGDRLEAFQTVEK
jgi:translation initiation factor IF-2